MISQNAAEGKEPQTERLVTRVQVLALPLACCVVLRKLLPLSGLQFSHLQIEGVRFDEVHGTCQLDYSVTCDF